MASKKVTMLKSWGNPTRGGGILRAGAKVELPEYWADKFVADGIAKADSAKPDKAKTEVQADGKGKS